MFGCLLALFMFALLAGGPLPDIDASVASLGDGTIGLSYDVRDGVTGDGHSLRIRLGGDTSVSFYHGDVSDLDDLDATGPAHVVLRVRHGRVTELDLAVGGSGRRARRADVDLGTVPPPAAAAWLLELAQRRDGDLADDAILAAAVARDAEVTPSLLEIARDRDRDADVRGSAVHWLVVLAGQRLVGDVAAMIADDAEDVEFREHAVFALSNLPGDEAVDSLLDIARGHRDPRLRRSALFALSRYEDRPEVVDLLEEILAGE